MKSAFVTCTLHGRGVMFKPALERASARCTSITEQRRLREFQHTFLETGQVPDSHQDVARVYFTAQREVMKRKGTARTAEVVTADGVTLQEHERAVVREHVFVESFTLDRTFLKIGETSKGYVCNFIDALITVAPFTPAIYLLPNSVSSLVMSSVSQIATISIFIAGGLTLVAAPALLAGMVLTEWKRHARFSVHMGEREERIAKEGV